MTFILLCFIEISIIDNGVKKLAKKSEIAFLSGFYDQCCTILLRDAIVNAECYSVCPCIRPFHLLTALKQLNMP